VAPPTVALNASTDVLKVRLVMFTPARVRVTVAVSVPVAVAKEIVPVQVVPAAIPDGLTETVKLVPEGPAKKLPDGERVSQVLLQEVPGVAWAVALIVVCAVTVRVCEAGAVPPAAALNVKAEELKVRPDAVGAVTLRVTVADSLPEAVIIEIVPVQVVPAVKPD
jgi:hypothetical protein